MTNDNANNKPEAETPSSDRREFLKKMMLAGVFATPVVATFSRGIRGSQSLQNALKENALSNGQGGEPLGDAGSALLSNATSHRPPLVYSNTTRRPRSSALSTTTTKAPKPKKKSKTSTNTTVKPRVKNLTLPPSTTRSTISYSNTTTPPTTRATTTTTKPATTTTSTRPR